MKLENTLENKAKFFTLYLLQNVLMWHQYSPLLYLQPSDLHSYRAQPQDFNTHFLKLTPLSQITDEDAIEVIKIFKGYSGMHKSITKIDSHSKELFKQFYWENPFMDGGFQGIDNQIVIANFSNEGIHVLKSNRESDYWHALDFLRSKGYALPWMGISIETLVEWGWIKLKDDLL